LPAPSTWNTVATRTSRRLALMASASSTDGSQCEVTSRFEALRSAMRDTPTMPRSAVPTATMTMATRSLVVKRSLEKAFIRGFPLREDVHNFFGVEEEQEPFFELVGAAHEIARRATQGLGRRLEALRRHREDVADLVDEEADHAALGLHDDVGRQARRVA